MMTIPQTYSTWVMVFTRPYLSIPPSLWQQQQQVVVGGVQLLLLKEVAAFNANTHTHNAPMSPHHTTFDMTA